MHRMTQKINFLQMFTMSKQEILEQINAEYRHLVLCFFFSDAIHPNIERLGIGQLLFEYTWKQFMDTNVQNFWIPEKP